MQSIIAFSKEHVSRYALYDIVLTIIFPRHYKSPDLGSISEDNRSHEDIDNCGLERAKHSPIEYHTNGSKPGSMVSIPKW